MKLSKELSWMTMDYINQKVANLALHECIALNDQVGVLAALDHGANPKSVVRLGEEREGLNAMERCKRLGDGELLVLLSAQEDL